MEANTHPCCGDFKRNQEEKVLLWHIMLLVVLFSSPLESDWILEQLWLVQRSQVRFNTEWPLRLQDSGYTRPQNRSGL